MPLLTVLTYPDKRLRLKAKTVESFDEALRQQVKNMFETMYEDGGVGLAATQVNYPWRVFVMHVSPEQNTPVCLINPEILHREGTALSEEGCLSLPDIALSIERSRKIVTRYMDEHGGSHERTSEGLECMCIQHELDHLDGLLAIDRVSKLKQTMLIKRMMKFQRA